MLDRETRRARILEGRVRMKRDEQMKSATEEVNIVLNYYFSSLSLKRVEKTTGDEVATGSGLKEINAIEKAEQEFWQIIEEEKRRRDKKNPPVRSIISNERKPSFKFFFDFQREDESMPKADAQPRKN